MSGYFLIGPRAHSLLELLLDNCSLRCKGVELLSDALRRNCSLSCLSLRRNGVRAEGARALADALAVSAGLHDLRLGHNEVGPKGVEALAATLQYSTLVTLDLESNQACCALVPLLCIPPVPSPRASPAGLARRVPALPKR